MRTQFRVIVVLVVAAGALVLVACSSTSSRIRERPEAYGLLSETHQQLVRRGAVARGMDTNAVYLALGPPSMAISTSTAEGPVLTWVYTGKRVELVPRWVSLPSGRGTWTLQYQPAHFSRNFTQAEVTFQAGQVVRWNTLPAGGRP